MGFLKPHTDKIYAVMRIFVGLLFMSHGLQKIFGLFGGAPAEAPPFIVYGAGGIELVGGALVAIGLYAAPAAFVCSGTMAAAYFMAHAANGFHPIVNKGELAVIYCWIFFVIAAKGAGIWSVDATRAKT
jgi:putative oxidoreductase